jgi:hypothetical protein
VALYEDASPLRHGWLPSRPVAMTKDGLDRPA